MSSAPARILPLVGPVLRGLAWAAVLAVVAASAAGVVDLVWHAPGSPARAELTHPGDAALGVTLDVATAELELIAADMASLAQEAKTALGEVASSDPTRLREALQRGADAAASIDTATGDLRESLIGLPGDGPTAAIEYSNATLVRRAAILAAIDAAAGLTGRWQQVSGRAADAALLTELIGLHDLTVLNAASKGRANEFAEAVEILDGTLLKIEDIQLLRVRLIASSEKTVLDEWIERNTNFDRALRRLYAALDRSGGEVTLAVQSANRDVELAFDQLPPDRRTILVIISEVARGGLTQAVLAIEEASAHVDEALAEANGVIPKPA
ncbi:MAG TPA: hypothetical protein VMQ65_03945 [Candidatus Limnocylindria bacterium]|nr:hypothetical protein [Candidatus Limnocylindria bacterium]